MSALPQHEEESGLKMQGASDHGTSGQNLRTVGEQVQGCEGSGSHVPSPLAHLQWPKPNGVGLGSSSSPACDVPLAGGMQGGPAEGEDGSGRYQVGQGHIPSVSRILRFVSRLPRLALRVPILVYRYTLSSFMGRQCRYLPTCSAYADEAISRHGAWPGLFMTTARICQCHPWGGDGFDPVPQCLPVQGRWYAPWRYGAWRMRPSHVDEIGEGAGRDRTSGAEMN